MQYRSRAKEPEEELPSEDEVLLPPNVSFEIVSVYDAGHGLTMVQCTQTETVDPVLDLAPSQADGAAEVVSRDVYRWAGSLCALPWR